MKPIICAAWSFRGATEGGESGIHNPWPVAWIPGLPQSLSSGWLKAGPGGGAPE